MGPLVDEGVEAVVEQVEHATRSPHVTLAGVHLVFELLGGGVDGSALIEGHGADLTDLNGVNVASAAEVGHFHHHALANEDVFGL